MRIPAPPYRPRPAKTDETGRGMTRQTRQNAALIAAFLVAGVLCGAGARLWIGGLNKQHAELERCIVASRQAHSGEDARSRLTHLDAEVPSCMNVAGYQRALDNMGCGSASWQGDVLCYVPKSVLGRLIYRIETVRRSETPPREG